MHVDIMDFCSFSLLKAIANNDQPRNGPRFIMPIDEIGCLLNVLLQLLEAFIRSFLFPGRKLAVCQSLAGGLND
jgi:hypothetical protein